MDKTIAITKAPPLTTPMAEIPAGLRPAQPVVTGAEALDAVVRVLRRFVWFARDEWYDIVALWIAHCYVYDAFKYTPRLHFGSDGPGCGKTLTMEIVGLMVPGLLSAAGITAPALRIVIENDHPTIALDEADLFFGASGRRHEDARAIINAGYEEQGKIYTAVGNGTGVKAWHVFGPLMFAGIGNLPPTVHDRAFSIRLAKPPRSQRPERYRPRMDAETVAATGMVLGEWVRSVGPELSDIIPDEIDGVELRQEAIAEPLLVIAELAGGGWKERGRTAVAAIFTNAGTPESVPVPPDIALLADIRTVFVADRMPTSALVRALMGLDGAPWGDMWKPTTAAAQLAGMLRPFGVMPRVMREGKGGKTIRGYAREDFAAVWASLPAEEAVPA